MKKNMIIRNRTKPMTFNEVFQAMTPFINSQTKRTFATLDSHTAIEYGEDDIFQLFSEALYTAYEGYDIRHGTEFATYAYYKLLRARKAIYRNVYSQQPSGTKTINLEALSQHEDGLLDEILIDPNNQPETTELLISIQSFRSSLDDLEKVILDNLCQSHAHNNAEIGLIFGLTRQDIRYHSIKLQRQLADYLDY